jgi:hypothetical protein
MSTQVISSTKIGDSVIWLGRKLGSCSNDAKFVIGEKYSVAHIYPSNLDVEIEQYIEGDHVTTRAGLTEFSVIKSKK